MFVDKDSIKINNVSFGQYLTQAEYQYNKLWSDDSGRNLAGSQVGTLIGIFPKLVLQFRRLTKDELHLIAPILDSASQTTQYYDDNKAQNVTMSTYTGDWSVVNKSININEPFSISVISRQRRA